MAEIYIELDNSKLAFKFVNKSLTLNLKLFGKNHINTAISYNTLGLYYQKNLNYIESLKYYQKALNIRLKDFGNDNIDTAISYYNIAIVYKNKQEYKNSIFYLKKALNIFLNNQKENYLILDNSQKKSYNKHYNYSLILSSFFTISYNYAKENPTYFKSIVEDLFKKWLNYKGNISNIENSIVIISYKINRIKKNIDKLKEKRIYLSTIHQVYDSDDTQKEINARKRELSITRDEISILEIELNKNYKIFKELLKIEEINSYDISSHLKKNHLYIDFVRMIDNYYIFTLDWKNNITIDMLTINETAKLEENIANFREINIKMTKRNRDIEQLTKDTNQHLSTIYKILNKYLSFKQDKDYLIISPDGVLNFLPFETLYYDEKYMINDKNITYIPSAKELVREFYRDNSIKHKTSKVVVFAHPNYNLSTTKEKDLSTPRYVDIGTRNLKFNTYFDDLKGSLKELKVITRFHNNVDIYKGKNATVFNLLKIKNPKILHISTHGFFLKNSSANFMQQSGLALAGANDTKLKCDTYGIVTALKLSNLELIETELVVLSACDTGVGRIEFAEGVSGLSKAFIQAGAKNIMMSLWSVDDKQTANLMENFYKNLNKKKTNYIDSLRDAKLQMIKLHPYYWSSFVINGI